MKQMELQGIPRRRAVLVEDRPVEGPATHPIAVIPAAILDARFPEGLKTQWYDPEEQLPWVSGFYEVQTSGFGFNRMAWYEKSEQQFYASTGEVINAEVSVWRGCVEALGRRRRVLLAH